MAAVDTIASYQGTSGSTLAAGTMASGDSSEVRNFPATGRASLLELFYDDVTSPEPFEIKSALLHDNVRGIEATPGATAPYKLLPSYGLQRLYAQDSLSFLLSTAATTGKALVAAAIYYSDLPGINSRLFSPGDILGAIVNIKPVFVAVGSGTNTAGAWDDLVLTTTENILKANTDYAVLGIRFDQAVAAVGIKGSDTGNLRVCVPGGVNNPYAADYFVRKSLETGLPLIPVINSANYGATYASIISSAATGADGTIQLILAQLDHNLS